MTEIELANHFREERDAAIRERDAMAILVNTWFARLYLKPGDDPASFAHTVRETLDNFERYFEANEGYRERVIGSAVEAVRAAIAGPVATAGVGRDHVEMPG